MRAFHLPFPSENAAIVLLGFLGSLLVGAVIAGRAMLDWTSPAFQYLVFGGGTAILFVVWKRKGFWESTTIALSFALYYAIPMRDLFVSTFVNTSLFFLFACCSFPLTWSLVRPQLRAMRFLYLAAVFAVFEMIKTPLMGWFMGSNEVFLAAGVNAVLAGTIGLGVGAGIELAEGIYHSPWMKRYRGHHWTP